MKHQLNSVQGSRVMCLLHQKRQTYFDHDAPVEIQEVKGDLGSLTLVDPHRLQLMMQIHICIGSSSQGWAP